MASTLTVETGAGITGANSFASIADADDYHTLRGNTAWAGASTAQKTAALVQASDYLNAYYRADMPPLKASQGLQWPEWGSDGLPAQFVAATVLLALYALSGPLSAPASRGIKAKTIKGDDAGEISTTYDDAAPSDPYPLITAILAPVASPLGLGGLTIGKLTR